MSPAERLFLIGAGFLTAFCAVVWWPAALLVATAVAWTAAYSEWKAQR